jgi:hypothetical protein
MDADQLLRHVVRPTLAAMDLYSAAAERLLLGTAAHESAGFRYLRQVAPGGADGVARGLYQIEPATLADLYATFLRYRPGLRQRLDNLAAVRPSREDQLAGNLAYATGVARVIYWRRPEPLPAADDLAGLAAYWKAHFNTASGAGTVEKWLADWNRYVAPVIAV